MAETFLYFIRARLRLPLPDMVVKYVKDRALEACITPGVKVTMTILNVVHKCVTEILVCSNCTYDDQMQYLLRLAQHCVLAAHPHCIYMNILRISMRA